jgi:hypothetical protein
MTVTQTSRASRDRTQPTSATDGDLLQLDTPVVSLHVHRPHMPSMPRIPGITRMPRMISNRGQEMNRAVETVKTFLPPAERIAYYSGLGLLAALGLVEWPVAVAIGAGTVLATRAGAQQAQRAQQIQQAQPAAAPSARPRASRAASTRASSRTPRSTSRSTGSTQRATSATERRSTA